jgi:hypothetical protein
VTAPVRIIIELELTEPVSGSMSTQRGEPIAFTGWLECHAGMEAICTAAKQRRAGSHPPAGHRSD